MTNSREEQIQDTVRVEVEPVRVDTDTSSQENIRTEEFKLSGDQLMSKFKELLREANVRRIILKNDRGNTLLDIPLTVGFAGGIAGILFFPVFVAIAAIAALVARVTLIVEKRV